MGHHAATSRFDEHAKSPDAAPRARPLSLETTMTTNGTRDAVRQTAQFFRKADSAGARPLLRRGTPGVVPGADDRPAQSPVLMFDLSRLTWLDYAEMRWHPQVNASLSLITFMLHQMDWHIESEDKKAAALVEENLRLIWTQLVRGICRRPTGPGTRRWCWSGRTPTTTRSSSPRSRISTPVRPRSTGRKWSPLTGRRRSTPRRSSPR